MSTSLLSHLFQAMDTVVLERQGAGSFKIITSPPAWLDTLWSGIAMGQENVNPGMVFPFLEYFLADAEAFWQTTTSGQLESGIWSEVDDREEEYHLKAIAVSMEGIQLLLIQYPKLDYHETHRIIQTGRELKLAYHRMLKEIQKKEVLLHCIVHDLKGPLAVMNGVFDMAADLQIPPDELQTLLNMGQRHVEKQERMIQDVLHAFAIDIKSLESIPSSLADAPDIIACARSVVAGLSHAFASLHIRLQLEPGSDDEKGWRVAGNREHLERIFTNLLENALRYNPPDSTVTVGFYKDGADIVTTVDDQGPGVPDALKVRLFEKLVQGEEKSGSSGIGLFFCRITVERWGGSIGVEDRAGGGSRFWFRLPQPS